MINYDQYLFNNGKIFALNFILLNIYTHYYDQKT